MTPALLELPVLFGFAATLYQAHTSGLLTHLCREGSQTAAALATALGLDERATAIVLQLLAAAGLVIADGDRFSATPQLVAYLVDLPGSAEADAKLWAHLPRFLATGEPFELPAREALYAQVVGAIGQRWQRDAARLSAALPPELGTRTLDVGCGSGVWSLVLAKQRPQMQITGLDFPAVLDSFVRGAESAGLRDRITLLPGDAFLCDLAPRSFDLVIIANVLRLESASQARTLIARVADAVAPAGALLIIDAFAAGSEAAELARTVYALHLALRERQGTVHKEASVRSWLSEAGFPEVQHIALDGSFSAVGALFARRKP